MIRVRDTLGLDQDLGSGQHPLELDSCEFFDVHRDDP